MAERVCPVWIGYLLASPLRKLFQNPEKMLQPYVEEGMTVLDIGSAMGFFSLPLAQMVGENGRVVCVDVQEKMLQVLAKRARKKSLLERMELRTCPGDSLNLEELQGAIDLALAIAVVHEVPDASTFFSEVYAAVKPGGRLLLSEPKGHVSEKDFAETVSKAEQAGFQVTDRPSISRSYSAVFSVPEE